MLGALFFGVGLVTKYNSEISFDKEKLTSCTTKLNIYDNDNNLINYASINGNKVVSLESLPDYVAKSFISIEDKKFYEHNGLNYKRMVKALITNITSKSIKQGASTISQQLIKNTHLSNEKTFERKIKEILLTDKLEKTCSKDEILETYLNVIYFGNSAYGIEDASLTYFNKPASELSIAESAGLAGIIKSPQYYSPVYNFENFNERKKLVLKNMLKDGYISKDQYETALNEKIKINLNTIKNKLVFENAVIKEACEILKCSEKDIATMGLKIYTTLKCDVQSSLTNTILNKNYYQPNRNGFTPDSCMICLNSKTGAVEGFYGNGNFNFSTFLRQPGSAIKPILVYAPAFESNIISPLTKIDNSEINIQGYCPQNIGGHNKEFVSVIESLSASLNIPAVKVLDYVGIDKASNFAKKNGIILSKQDNNLNIALGGFTDGINIVDLAGSYTAFANSGYYSKPYFIEKITTINNREIYSHKQNSVKTMREDTAYLMTDILKKATKNGTSKRLKDLNFDIAGKTGTVGVSGTNYNTDAWSIAYTTDHIVCSWLGNGDGKNESTLEGNNNGGTFATSMVKQVFDEITLNKTPENFKMPESVIELEIDSIQYEKFNKIVPTKNLKECYVMTGLFSKYNLPQENISDYQTNFKAYLENFETKISFNAYPNYEYILYRVENGKRIKLKTYSNLYKEITETDRNFLTDTDFYYELEYKKENNIITESTDNFYVLSEQKKWFF